MKQLAILNTHLEITFKFMVNYIGVVFCFFIQGSPPPDVVGGLVELKLLSICGVSNSGAGLSSSFLGSLGISLIMAVETGSCDEDVQKSSDLKLFLIPH